MDFTDHILKTTGSVKYFKNQTNEHTRILTQCIGVNVVTASKKNFLLLWNVEDTPKSRNKVKLFQLQITSSYSKIYQNATL